MTTLSDKRADSLPVKIDGQGYVLDTSGFQRNPVAAQRQLVDDGEEPGDRSINGQGSWKRTQWSFDHGAGQTWWDEDDDTDRRQFFSSVGLDPWTRRELKLLPDTTQVDTDPITRLCATGSDLLAVTAAGALVTVTDPWATWPAGVGTTAVDVAFDGTYVYVARTTGIDRILWATGVTTSAWSATVAQRLVLTGGRLVALVGGDLFEIAGDGTSSSVDTASPGRDFVGVVEMGGETYSWDRPVIATTPDLNRRSMLYRHAISDIDTSLDPGDSVLELPPGEHITAAYGYSNVLVLGTNKGIRVAQATSGSNLAHGGLIALDVPVGWDSQVVDFCADGQFVWFTWTNFADGKSGLGRLDVDAFIEPGVPAHATDIHFTNVYVDGVTRVTSCTILDGRLVFGGSFGAYVQATTLMERGEMRSGWINHGSPERKAILGMGLRSQPLPAGSLIQGSVYIDKGRGQEHGLVALEGEGRFTVNGSISGYHRDSDDRGAPGIAAEGEEMDVRIRFLRATDGTSPILRRWTLRVLPLPFRVEEIVLPLIIQHRTSDGKTELDQDPDELLAKLRHLYRSRRVIRIDIGTESLMGYVDGVSIERDSSVTKVRGWSRKRSSLTGVYGVTVITTGIPVDEHQRVSYSESERGHE